jgi:16S rRNA (guanine527-N7)-methyltransferase
MINQTESSFAEYLLKSFEIEISNKQLKQFSIYYSFLRTTNEIVNLTTIKDINDVYFRHFADSVSSINEINENNKIVDVGFGAGFPSIPLKILKPNLKLTLIDNDKTKCIFIKRLIHELNLSGITVINSDVRKVRDKYDVFLSRAFTSIENLLDISKKILKPGGLLVYQTVKDEFPNLMKGFELKKTFKYNLPINSSNNINHYIIKIK